MFKIGETNIDENKIKDLVGIPKFIYIHSIIEGIINKNVEVALKAVDKVLEEGKDLENFLWEMIKYTKDILMYKVSKKNEIYSKEEIMKIEEISDKTSKEELINIIYKLSELENKMKWSSQKTIIFETGIIKLCTKEDILSLNERIEKLEKIVQSGNIKIDTMNKPNVIKNNIPEKKEIIKEEENKKTDAKDNVEKVKKMKLEKGNIIVNWNDILNNLKKQGKVILYANLINTEAIEINDMTVSIRFYNGLNSFRKELLQKPENMSILVKAVSMACGKEMLIKLEDASSSKLQKTQEKPILNTKKDQTEEDVISSLDIPINIIEE